MDLGLSITVVGCAASMCPIAIAWIRQHSNKCLPVNGNGKTCSLHPIMLTQIDDVKKTTKDDISEIKRFTERRDDEVWEAIKEIREDVKELLKR